MNKNESLSNESITEVITDDFSESIKKEFISPSSDIVKNLAEITVDNFMDDGLLKQIPILSTVISGFKITGGIRNFFFLKKLAIFFQEYRLNQIDPEKVSKFNNEFENDKTYRNKVVEFIIIQIDRLENLSKTEILAKLLLGYTEGNYDWNDFKDLVASLNIIHPKGIRVLNNNKNSIEQVNYIINSEPLKTTAKQEINLQKDIESIAILESAGLIFKGLVSPPKKSNVVGQETTMLTALGCNFIEYGLS